MVGAEHQMPGFVHERTLGLGGRAPEQENHALVALRDTGDDCVGQNLPTLAPVAVGLALFDRQAGVEQ